jgi:uracil-DNA glycosylase
MLQSPLEHSWNALLREELKAPYMRELEAFLKNQKRVFPKTSDIFAALNHTPFDQVKVVILGQDPYHGEGQANGLCFSVRPEVKIPPSLVNIFKELQSDLGGELPKHGDLTAWARQGVLLLNNVLTVEEGRAGAHHKKGWERFTDAIIHLLNERKEHLVFILWGSPAQKKASFVDEEKHLVLKSVHPSPLSVYRGFYGSRPFSKTNAYLKKNRIGPIDWQIT